MIAANELRIGNWVMYDNRLFQIEAISRSLPCLNTDEFGIGVVDWNNLQPIPLTTEILEKCGFEKGLSEWYNKKYFTDCKESAEVMELQINLKSFRCGIFDTDFGGTNAMTAKRIEHLHQLQNLYFALTNTELNYHP